MFGAQLTQTLRMGRHALDHLALRWSEPIVVLEEVGVPHDMDHDQLLLHGGVRAHQVGDCRVIVDDQLIDLREPVAVALVQPFEIHPEAPGAIARREPAVGRDRVDLLSIE